VSDYSKSYDGAAKDSAEDPISGAEFDTEFAAIAAAIATKVNEASISTGNLLQSGNGGDTLADSGETVATLKTYARQPDYHEDTNSNKVVDYLSTASAVNFLTVNNAASGGDPELSVGGTDTNIDLQLSGKGSGVVKAASLTVTSALVMPAGSVDTSELATDSVTSAKIAANAVGASEIADDSVSFAAEIATKNSTGQWAVGGGATQVIPEGVYLIDAAVSNAGHYLQMKGYSGSWVNEGTMTLNFPRYVISDGVHLRAYNSTGTAVNFRYRRIF
jgi:hypothetical protein